MNPVCQWPFNVLIMLVTYCALIDQTPFFSSENIMIVFYFSTAHKSECKEDVLHYTVLMKLISC